ncbi:hypothetical protein ACJRO7_035105 [Eucalyptus globulus]|uniref:Uncharacterized protein n=1 Tax=Eucalyptus globulus TaxID=34317 RepID=A0ABD3JF96_EUCGL
MGDILTEVHALPYQDHRKCHLMVVVAIIVAAITFVKGLLFYQAPVMAPAKVLIPPSWTSLLNRISLLLNGNVDNVDSLSLFPS